MVLIPYRDINAINGSEFIKNNKNVIERENNILKEFLSGNIPDFLRNFIPINICSGNDNITYMVMNDYLSIGSNNDYIRMPMNPITAQKIADQYDCTLPTSKMVLDIWKQSTYKTDPLPWGPPYDDSMMSSERIEIHNNRIKRQLLNKDISKLISGHKKDIILSNSVAPNNPNKKVVIYGWIEKNGIPIQKTNYWSHEVTYADYSHGIRLIANDVIVNNSYMRIQDVFKDDKLSLLLNNDGVLNFLRY